MKKTGFLAVILAVCMLSGAFVSCGVPSTPADSDASDSVQQATDAIPDESTAPDSAAETDVQTEDDITAEAAEMTAAEKFRYDNFANGKLSDKLLDSVNPGVLALLSCCMYYESELQRGISLGQKWVYSNSSTYVPQNGTFESMVASGKYGANCAMPQAWAFIDLGIVQNGKHIYGSSTGEMANFSSLGKYIGAVCTLTSWEGSVKFNELYTRGEIQPGDIFLAKSHTFIYMGDNKFLAAGHDGHWHTDSSANTEDSRKAVFDSWVYDMTSCTDYTYTVYWQIRFKDDYVPRFYRNSEGKLVSNPLYDASKNIEYKQGVSPETPEVIYKVEQNQVYDTSGRTNVLQGITPSASNGFNMSKINNASNMTDGQLYYDNTTKTYADCVILGGNAYASNPTYWFEANGEKSATKDGTHKYLCGIKFNLSKVTEVDSFSIYTQAVGASTNKPFGDIDGFDVLVSEDGVNWQVAYSIENAMCEGKWTDTNDEKNKASTGYYMCHYIRADFDRTYSAKYVMLAITQPRTQTAAKEGVGTYSLCDGSLHYFRVSEFQVYEKAAG